MQWSGRDEEASVLRLLLVVALLILLLALRLLGLASALLLLLGALLFLLLLARGLLLLLRPFALLLLALRLLRPLLPLLPRLLLLLWTSGLSLLRRPNSLHSRFRRVLAFRRASLRSDGRPSLCTGSRLRCLRRRFRPPRRRHDAHVALVRPSARGGRVRLEWTSRLLGQHLLSCFERRRYRRGLSLRDDFALKHLVGRAMRCPLRGAEDAGPRRCNRRVK